MYLAAFLLYALYARNADVHKNDRPSFRQIVGNVVPKIKLSSSCFVVESRLCHFDPWRLIPTYRGFYVLTGLSRCIHMATDKAGSSREMTKNGSISTFDLGIFLPIFSCLILCFTIFQLKLCSF